MDLDTYDFDAIEAHADAECEALMSPLPSVVVRSLRDDPDWVKCPRCWHYHTIKDNYDHLCDRCCLALIEGWPDHPSTPHIVALRAAQQSQFGPTRWRRMVAVARTTVRRLEARVFPNLIRS